jgi:hypothetical protein
MVAIKPMISVLAAAESTRFSELGSALFDFCGERE